MLTQKQRNTRFKLRKELVELAETLQQLGGFETLGAAVNYVFAVYGSVVVEHIKQQQQQSLPPSTPVLAESPVEQSQATIQLSTELVDENLPPATPELGGFGDSMKRIRQKLVS